MHIPAGISLREHKEGSRVDHAILRLRFRDIDDISARERESTITRLRSIFAEPAIVMMFPHVEAVLGRHRLKMRGYKPLELKGLLVRPA